jgi:hypothetical protein
MISHSIASRYALILYSHLLLCLPSGIFPQVSTPKPSTLLSSPPYVPNAPPVSFFLVLSLEYLVSSTDHKAPNYAVFYSPFLPCHSVTQWNDRMTDKLSTGKNFETKAVVANLNTITDFSWRKWKKITKNSVRIAVSRPAIDRMSSRCVTGKACDDQSMIAILVHCGTAGAYLGLGRLGSCLGR